MEKELKCKDCKYLVKSGMKRARLGQCQIRFKEEPQFAQVAYGRIAYVVSLKRSRNTSFSLSYYLIKS